MDTYDISEHPTDRIQVVTSDHDWNEAEEVFADSELLEPFYNYIVTDMSCERSYADGGPVLRIALKATVPERVHLFRMKAA